MFRLGKTYNEYRKITELLNKGELDGKRILAVATRAFMAAYWIFDNLQVLSSVKFLKYDPKEIGKKAATFWFIGLILSVVGSVIKLAELAEKEAGLKKKELTPETKKAIADIKKAKFAEVLNLIKFNGDIITASSAS